MRKKKTLEIDTDLEKENNEGQEPETEVITIKKEGFSYPEMIIIMVIAILFGFLIGNVISFTKGSFVSNEVPKELDEFVSTYKDLVNNYYEDIDKEELIDAGIEGMINYLDDPYATYFDENSSVTFNETLEGNYEGVGIEVTYQDEKIVITKVFENTPASKAGLEVDDVIIKINDDSVAGKSLTEAVKMIKESENKTVQITIERNGEEKTVSLTRTNIEVPQVSSKVIEHNNKKIGYIRIEVFSLNVSKQFEEALEKLSKEKVEGFVLDVRDNPGGYLGQVTDMLSLFMTKKDVIYQLETKDKKEKVYGNSKNAKYDEPVVVIINENSASASEILASAFKETYGSPIIGVASYGKGTVQKTGDLNNGDTIKYTVQKWLTPKGNWINKEGVQPTKEVKIELQENEILTEENDTQLRAALDAIVEEIK